MSAVASHFQVDSASDSAAAARSRIWAGRILSGLVAAFLLFDAGAKVAMVPAVLEASAKLGFTPGAIFGIGVALLVSTIVYLVPRTSMLGAVLLTGYLGGAICTHVNHFEGAFPIVFASIFALLVWTGLGLRDDRVRALFAPKRPAKAL